VFSYYRMVHRRGWCIAEVHDDVTSPFKPHLLGKIPKYSNLKPNPTPKPCNPCKQGLGADAPYDLAKGFSSAFKKGFLDLHLHRELLKQVVCSISMCFVIAKHTHTHVCVCV